MSFILRRFYHLGTPEANTYEETPNFDFGSALSGSNLSDFMLGAVTSFQQDAGVYYNYSGNEAACSHKTTGESIRS